MNNEENQSKPIAEKSQQSNEVPSKEAIEIAARIMANRAKREIDLDKLQKPKIKMDSSNLLNEETPLWKRIWISLVVVFAIGFGIFVLSHLINDSANALRIVFVYLLFVGIFAAISFVIVRLIKWAIDAMGERKLGTFTKIIITQIVGLILLLVFYYVASPYQNCIRQNSYKNFCIKETSW